MSDPIKEIYCLLDEFEAEITQERSFWNEVKENNPEFEPVSEESCQEKITRMWLHGETETYKCYELERWLYGDPPATKIAQSPALSVYKDWRKWLKIAGIPKFTTRYDYDKRTRWYREVKSEEPSDMYYVADKRFDIEEPTKDLRFGDNKLIIDEMKIDSYLASAATDFIRHKLIQMGNSFTFETVMSHPGKIEILQKAQEKGYRTYLYFIATEDPEINITRIQHRIKTGGHSVPKNKIRNRYDRSLALLSQAIQFINRAYIFDNSRQEPIWLAEITDGKILEMKSEWVPDWFEKALLKKLKSM